MWGTKGLPTYGLGALPVVESINQQEAGWVLGPVWKIPLSSEFDPSTVQPVESGYNEYILPATTKWPQLLNNNTVP
jgi:hypothetical protein